MYRRFLFLSALAALILSTILILGVSGPARAQNVGLAGFSETEKIGFAFYHLSKHKPPFDEWTRARADYQAASMKERLLMIDEQRIRLNEGYLHYFPDRDLISLRLLVKITGGPNPEFQKDQALQDAGLSHKLRITFVDLQDVPYIPVQVGQLWIGIVPDQLETLTTHYVTEDEYRRLEDGGVSLKGDLPTMMQIILRPKSADAKTPLLYNDVPVFLMMADVGALVMLHKKNGSLLWEYAAQWYEYKRASSLMTLYAK